MKLFRMTKGPAFAVLGASLFFAPLVVGAEGFNSNACVASLQKLGATPCPNQGGTVGAACAEFNSPVVHQFCAQQAMYSPVRVVAAQSKKTKEFKVFASAAETMNFLQQNPDWNASNCSCCCP